MADLRPDLDVLFETFGEAAMVTIPDGAPIPTSAVKQAAFNERFPADPGNFSLTKGRQRISLRLDDLGVDAVPHGTVIVIGAENWSVEATDVLDDQVAHVLARKFTPAP
jgi:hypothetical protein